jgi:hypothetical protein
MKKILYFKKISRKKVSFWLFILIGIILPYILFSILQETANLFLWEAEERFWLLFFTPISIATFVLIKENLHLLIIKEGDLFFLKIFFKSFLFHITLLLVGMYLLCSFIEAEMNISKWKVVINSIYSEDSGNGFIQIVLCILFTAVLFFIIFRDSEYIGKRLEEKKKEMYIKKLKGF